MFGGSRRLIRRGRLLESATVADQQDGGDHAHRVTIAVEALVAAGAGKPVRGAAATDDTIGADAEEPVHVGAEEPMHVAPAAAISVGQRAP